MLSRPLRIVVLVAVIAAVAVRFVMRDGGSHSASDTLRPLALETIAIVVVAILVVRFVEGRR